MIGRFRALFRRAVPNSGAAPGRNLDFHDGSPAPVSEDSALAHVETAHRMVTTARCHTGQWLAGERHLSTRDALRLADSAREAAEHLRTYAAYITTEVALAEELAAADPDDVGRGGS